MNNPDARLDRDFRTADATGSFEPRLIDLMTKVRRRLLLVDSATGSCWGLFAALLTALLAMWLDLVWELPPLARAASWGCASVVFVAAFARQMARTWQSIQARRIARQIDSASGFQGEWLNGFEFAALRGAVNEQTNAAHNVSSDPLTTGLATMAVERAGRLSECVQRNAVISRQPAVIAARALATGIALVALLAFICPTLARSQWQRFAQPWDDTPPYTPYKITVEPGDTEVVYGQGLEVRVTVDGPVARDVHLMLTTRGQTEKVPMFPETNGTWRTQLSRLTEETTYLARVDRARSSSFHIRIITTPTIDDVQFVVTPPKYTHEQPTMGSLPKSGLIGLAGTVVRVTARSNRPLSLGEIRLTSDAHVQSVQLRPTQPGDSSVVGEFAIAQSAKFDLHLTDTDGQASQEPFVGSITLLIDQRPLVRILEPKAQSLATPTTTLPIILDAEDDFGLSSVELYRSLNDSRPISNSLPVPEPSPRRFHDQQYLPLARYGLQPGDEIKLFARVVDNEPNNPKGAESTVVTVRIISQADFEKMLRIREGLEVLVSKYQQAERRLESLADEIAKIQKELENADPDSPLADELRERLEKLAKEMQEEAEAIANAADHDLPYDIDQNLKQKLKDLAEKLKQAGDELQKLTKKSDDKSELNNEAIQRQLEKMAMHLAEQKEQFNQEATDPLNLLAMVYPLMEDQARFTSLVLWQIDLAERLAAYKGIEQSEEPAAKARLRDLQDEQRRLREELEKLLDDIENHVQQLPEDEQFDKLRDTATQFALEVRNSGAIEEMVSAESELTAFRGAAAHLNAQEAAEILKSFLSKCQGMGGEGGTCLAFNPSLSDCLGNTIEQLLAEAGLSMGSGAGQGMGSGGRGGFSMRSGNRNVGLYGGMEMLGGKANSGRGFGTSGKVASGKSGSNDTSADSESVSAPWRRSASTANSGSLPSQYRRRVNQYFHRVATELEQAGK